MCVKHGIVTWGVCKHLGAAAPPCLIARTAQQGVLGHVAAEPEAGEVHLRRIAAAAAESRVRRRKDGPDSTNRALRRRRDPELHLS